jgi:hypothetical protein
MPVHFLVVQLNIHDGDFPSSRGESARWGIPLDLSIFLPFPGAFAANFLSGHYIRE